jgi:hypothetical protein
MKNAFIPLLSLALACAVACDSSFEPGSRVSKLRLLAVRAEPTFAAPGDAVTLDVLAVDPAERPLAWALATCTNPVASTVDACLDALDGPLAPVDPERAPLSLVVPDDVLSALPEPARANASVGVVLVACPGTLDDGPTQGVPVACLDAGGEPLPLTEFEVGMKRVFVRQHDDNAQPRITEVRWDGEPWPEGELRDAEACDVDGFDIEDCPARLRHRIDVEAGQAESGVDEHGTPFDEQLIVQAYATSGLFREGVRIAEAPGHQWAARREDAEDVARLWLVVRDDRGGVDWVERQVRIE